MPTAKKTTVKKTTRRTTTRRVVRNTAPATTTTTRRPMIDPVMAVKRFFTGYFDFMGRSTRSEFWFGLLFVVIVDWIFWKAFAGKFFTIILAVLFSPLLALFTRRFRDAGVSVWWYLIPTLIALSMPLIFGGVWYNMATMHYVSTGMLLYGWFCLAFIVFKIVVGCLSSKK